MKHQRNIEGLRQNAQKKRQESFEKVEQGVKKLLRAGHPVNFNAVAEASGVSRAWLYKEPDIKERIAQLREQGVNKKKPSLLIQKLSDGSKDGIIATLKTRIGKLEQRNRELSQQNEVFGGQVLKVRELEQQIKRFQYENVLLQSVDNSAMEPAALSCEVEAEIERI